jgi:hypothetical protein
MKKEEVITVIKAISKIAFIALIIVIAIKALIKVISLSLPLRFWALVLAAIYGFTLFITEKDNNKN